MVLLSSTSAGASADAFFLEHCDPSQGYYNCTPSYGHDSARVGIKVGAGTSHVLITGNGTEVQGQYSTLFGHRARTLGDNNAVFGHGAYSLKGASATFGAFAGSNGIGAVAVGQYASAWGDNAMALGSGAKTAGGGEGQIAIGNDAVAGNEGWSGAVAVGQRAKASHNGVAMGHQAQSQAEGAVALGERASAVHANSVALGANSVTAGVDTVSVGSASNRRRIQYIADGVVAAGSTDAITGNQLHATEQDVASAQATAATAKTSADTALAKANAVSGLIDQDAPDGTVRLGGENTGNVLDVSNKDKASRRITGVDDAALTAGSTDAVSGRQLHKTNEDVALAQASAATAKTSADTALAKANAVSGLIDQVAPNGAVRLGGENTGTVLDVSNKANARRRITGVDDAALNAGSTDAVSGRQLHKTNEDVALAQASAATAKTSADTALAKAAALDGLVGQSAANGDVRLGGENTGNVLDVSNKAKADRRITGVADATLGAGSNEAVTGRQLFATDQKVGVHEGTLSTHATQLAGQDGRITTNRNDVDALRTDLGKIDADLTNVVKFSADGSIDLGGNQLRGVASGDISSASSMDAVNGGQLFATNERLAKVEGFGKYVGIGGGGPQVGPVVGNVSIAIGDSAVASVGGEGAVAVGAFAQANGMNSVALGRSAVVVAGAKNAFALGTQSLVEASSAMAIGAESHVIVGATDSVALGSKSIADEAQTVSLGHSTLTRRLVNVARGKGENDATTGAQLNESLATFGGGARMDADGKIIAPTYTIQGASHTTVETALTALDGAVTTTGTRIGQVEDQLRNVFQDKLTTRADGLDQLSLAGAQGMVLSNVASGVIAPGSRDAVNGGQLHDVQQQLSGRIDGLEQRADGPVHAGASASIADAPPAAQAPEPAASAAQDAAQIADTGKAPSAAPQPPESPKEPMPQVDTAELEKMLARANEYTDGAIGNVERRLDKMDKRFDRMAAMSSAQSAMAMNTAGLATYNRLGAGVGYSEGESALAMGYQRVLNERGSATFSLHGSFTNSGDRGMGMGVGIGW